MDNFSMAKLVFIFPHQTNKEAKKIILEAITYKMYHEGVFPGCLGDCDHLGEFIKVGIYSVPMEIHNSFKGNYIYDGLCLIEGSNSDCPTNDEFACTDALALRLFSIRVPSNVNLSYSVILRMHNFNHEISLDIVSKYEEPVFAIQDLIDINPKLYWILLQKLMVERGIDGTPENPYAYDMYKLLSNKECLRKYPKLVQQFKKQKI